MVVVGDLIGSGRRKSEASLVRRSLIKQGYKARVPVLQRPRRHLQFALDHRGQGQNAAMKSKTQQIREAIATGDQIGALRIAARLFDRSDDTKTFKRGMDAYNNPGFHRQLGKQPDHVVTQALKILLQRFSQKAG
jgi:hypothetical protein